MTDDSASGVRRVGRKDRKRRITSSAPLFPVDEGMPLEAESAPAEVVPEANPTERVVQPPEADRFPQVPAEVAVSQRTGQPVRSGGGCVPNLVTLLFVAATVGAIALFAVIVQNPYSSLNPFPPFTPLPIIVTATFLPPTATLEPSPGPTATFTPLPPESIAASSVQFVLQGDTPSFTANTNDQGCNWLSIAGSVTDSAGAGLSGYRVKIAGAGRDETVFSGSASSYGVGGFELVLGNIPAEQSYVVQLQTPQGEAVSAEYAVLTRADCAANVMILRFVQVGVPQP
ncbi:MAG: hypothetical protein JNM70_11235 [Anaerolineae bacterium]|nr:hypothetical protein [Anaerolineae bacterium]